MVQFTKVRLSGFKSFVDATELVIEEGLTGVVGPNGCGKSNLLEALRWCMGENSAKQMRGGEMDDVIFNGTSERPARNLAEVTIHLDNCERKAPAHYNENEDIEVVRRIERGEGSDYRINGRSVRARDVQLLFADLSTGPRSTAIVSQGKVGALINAKPAQRRMLLEEAAGISGLHTRRHEAELRLRAAETNLARVEDVIEALTGQLQGLKRQARQAQRYRKISDDIRHNEAIVLHLKWEEALRLLDTATAHLRETESKVAALAGQVAAITAEQAEAADALPALRQTEAAAAAELQRLVLAREQLDAEEARIAETQAEYKTRLAQIETDLERERNLVAEAEAALKRLDEEHTTLTADQHDQEQAEAAASEVAAAEEKLEGLEAELTALTHAIAEADAHRAGLKQRLEELRAQEARLAARAASIGSERDKLAALGTPSNDVADQAAEQAQAALDQARAEADTAETTVATARDAEANARERLNAATEAAAKLRAEGEGLRALQHDEGALPNPAIDLVEAAPGYEAALAAALGEDLTASTDNAAPRRWAAVAGTDGGPALPKGARALADFITAPPALARRLAQIGVVEDAKQGEALAGQLAQGQRLVSTAGDLWRWDGYCAMSGAASPAESRLRQRNRLAEIEKALAAATAEADKARKAFDAAKQAGEGATVAERGARETVRQATKILSEARAAQAAEAKAIAERATRAKSLEEAADNLETDLAETRKAMADAEARLAAATDDVVRRKRHETLRGTVQEKRGALVALRQRLDRLRGEAEARARRLAALGSEVEGWTNRLADGRGQIDQLEDRRAKTIVTLDKLANQPDEIAGKRSGLIDSIAASEARRAAAAETLHAAEGKLHEVEKRLKAAEAQLADLREERGRSEGAVSQAQQLRDQVAERIAERLHCAPEKALEAADAQPDELIPDLADLERRLERLMRERDNIGPVNLRAEREAEELDQQITTLQTERGDLLAAIGRFRQAINELNREGRDRLIQSFDSVNKHFKDLFVRLFGGGRAHLELVESDDPLEAGLEIMASPPGKKLQIMSLLSGGEQALTALSLLFAVFMTNPAPICILDEVDAPLDDANVDRFCTLLDEIAESTKTRFLLITHHRMTMARMDRLFGVTMSERGVSQLVSVDLQEAERLRAIA